MNNSNNKNQIKNQINESVGGLNNIVSFLVDKIYDFYNFDGSFGFNDIIGDSIDNNIDQFYPNTILINGRSGIGKSVLIQSVLRNLSHLVKFKIVNSSNLFQRDDGDTEKLIENLFITSSTQSPFVLVFEEVDSVSQIRNDTLGYIEQRVVSSFLTLLERNSRKRSVFVIGITSRIESMDTSFFSIGKFDTVINIPIPSPKDRENIIYLLFKKFPNFEKFSDHYKKLSKYIGGLTHGFVGSDLNSLCKEAILNGIKRQKEEGNNNGNGINSNKEEDFIIKEEDFNKSFEIIKPSILNQYKLPATIEKIQFSDIGGLEEIIEKIKSSILTPILNRETLDKLGIKPPSGILLYGPTGNGKSLIARAIASASPNINFISVQSTDIIDPVVGASEKNISKLFKTLRESSPCILFLDQIEVLAKFRGFSDSADQSSDRLLSCLLTEIDGIYSSGSNNSSDSGSNNSNSNNNQQQCIILGATTRIDLLDPSVLRPGRFDYHIYIPNPDQKARKDILEKITRVMPLDDSIDFNQLSNLTIGFNGADLNNLCKETALYKLRSNINSSIITMDDFIETLKLIKPSIKSLF